MTSNEFEQAARIIETIFQAEEQISPFTVAEMFRVYARMLSCRESSEEGEE